MFVNKALEEKEKKELVDLLKEFRDVFAWSCDEMPGLSPALVTYNLAVCPRATPVK